MVVASVSISLVLDHVLLLVNGAAGLRVVCYRKSCPKAESIVKRVTCARAAADPSLAAKMLRMERLVMLTRLDASVIQRGATRRCCSTARRARRRRCPTNRWAGWARWTRPRRRWSRRAPGADVLALATRDAVSFQFRRSLWKVETRRRDSRTSFEGDGFKVPKLESTFPELKGNFSERGLSVADLVALSGAHTLGRINCTFVTQRLFPGDGGLDALIDRRYVRAGADAAVPQPGVDRHGGPGPRQRVQVRHQLLRRRQGQPRRGPDGRRAAARRRGRASRRRDARPGQVPRRLREASINKMGAFQVLTGNTGEIRRNCRVVN
ncbi:hypothetical protein ACP70R_004861 [Stipagrostis hirtigluma subsp. patula]